jgi:hypothetical protein
MNLTAVAIFLNSLCLLTLYGIEDQNNSNVCFLLWQKEHQIQRKKETPPSSNIDCKPFRLTASYSEGPGVGYNKSYSSLQGFFSPINTSDHWLPFIDVRGHIFSDGKPAANVGLGVRYLASLAWGVNAYYDYRTSHHHNYRQVGLGFEVLGSFWDVRLNGYLPVGKKKSRPFDKINQPLSFSSFSSFTPQMIRFNGNNAIVGYSNIPIYQSQREEFAFKGVDASVGFQVGNPKKISLNFAAGPYYYAGYFSKYAVGGQGSITVRWSQYIALSATTSYDNLFHSRTSGSISLTIPLGNTGATKKEKSVKACSNNSFLDHNLARGAHRNEIIVLDKHRFVRQIGSINVDVLATNPQTGQPYIFWHVNNTSSSNGTYESPYPTLAQAEAASAASDIIYVYSGDGTTTGMDAGITLKDDQKFFGAGIDQTLLTTTGVITIPAQDSGMPQVTNTTGPVVTCANNNEISGFYFTANNQYVLNCTNISDALIHDNTLSLSAGSSGRGVGIYFKNSAGTITVQDNSFLLVGGGSSAPWGIQLSSTAADTNYLISNNDFSGDGLSFCSAIELGQASTVGDFGILEISENQFSQLLAKSIGGRGFSGIGRIIIDANTFSDWTVQGFVSGNVFLRMRPGANINALITNNTWQGAQLPAIPSVGVETQDDTSQVCVTLTDNVSDALSANAYSLVNTAGTFTADISGNTGIVGETGVINHASCPAFSIDEDQ